MKRRVRAPAGLVAAGGPRLERFRAEDFSLIIKAGAPPRLRLARGTIRVLS